jgi:uroporphyrinogen-III synthase
LLDGFRARGAEVSTVRVYQWDLPEDTGPLREAVHRVAAGAFGAALFTTSIQVAHLFRIAAEEGIEEQVRGSLSRMMVAAIGPTTSEALEDDGVRVDFEPSHPKMGVFVQEAAAAFAKERR